MITDWLSKTIILLKAWVFFILPSEKLQTLTIFNKNYKEQQQLTIIILFTEVEVKIQVYILLTALQISTTIHSDTKVNNNYCFSIYHTN